MKRKRIIRIGAWLFLGLAAALLVGWGCALAGRTQPARMNGPLNDGSDDWAGTFDLAFGVEHYELFRLDDWMTPPPLEKGWDHPRPLPGWARRGLEDRNIRQCGRFASGWPLRCLVASMESVYDEKTARRRWTHWGYITLGKTARRAGWNGDLAFDDKLPVRPLWGGLAVNALVFAVVGWLVTTGLSAVPRMVRRALRGKKQCRRCGYDLRGVPGVDGVVTCPECGRPAVQV